MPNARWLLLLPRAQDALPYGTVTLDRHEELNLCEFDRSQYPVTGGTFVSLDTRRITEPAPAASLQTMADHTGERTKLLSGVRE